MVFWALIISIGLLSLVGFYAVGKALFTKNISLEYKHVTKIINCARCGLDHINLDFEKLNSPVYDDDNQIMYTHWCPCPTNGQPILMVEVETKS